MTTNINISEVTFGIEIEACVPVGMVRDLNIRVGGYHRGIQVTQLPAGWNAQSDASISCPVGYVGIEFVSPKLQGEDGLRQIEQVCDWLNSIGAKVNNSTGLHVHVGVDSLDAAGLARLISLVSYYEKALYASTGTTSRETGSFCRSIKAKYAEVQQKKTADYRVLNNIASDHCDRYHILNLHPLASGQRQAVEFRVFAGTTSSLKIKAAVQICLALVHKAATSAKMSNWDAKVSRNAKFAGKGEGWISLHYMLKRIGWIKTRSTQEVFGLIRTDEAKEYTKEMLRLADKYDSRV
jgi:hypothetical protein